MKIRSEIFEIKGAPFEGLNPLPKFRARRNAPAKTDEAFPAELKKDLGNLEKVLPYLTQDRYSRKRDTLRLKSFVLENEYLVARFLPEYGGRLHSLYDKVNGRELLLANPVIQPGNLAIRNAWLSGGIEWNVGNFGHTYTTCDNVYAAVLNDGAGNDFLRIYEFERNKSIFWQVDIHLPDGSPRLISHVRLVNPFDRATTTYWWTNIAVHDEGSTRVLASNKNVISFVEGKCKYETLPKLDALDGIDATYPGRSPRAYDYFIQKNEDGESTWEAAAYPDGLVFYERSTAPLYYKKLFSWGNHRAGKHWQEFLSDGEGTGYYAEIQAGIAPSQLHDMPMPAHGKYEWTQCFGGVKLDPEKLFGDYDAAVDAFGEKLDGLISKNDIEALDARLARLADIPVTEEAIMHHGAGFGALEIMRAELDGDAKLPKNLCFPKSDIGTAEKKWEHLLANGTLPEEDVKAVPTSYMVSPKWLPHLEKALARPDGKTWNALLHYGVARYEYHNTEVTINASFSDEEDAKNLAAARDAWLESVRLAPNVWAYRNLAVLEEQRGDNEAAEAYYDAAIALPAAFEDFALASEYLRFLLRNKSYEKLWSIYERLPENCKAVDRVKISAAHAAVKLRHLAYLEAFFAEEHHDIREGEASLTDIWFEYCALKLAAERGIRELDSATLDALIDEAWELCPPDKAIDFRMSTDKRYRYRVQG